jgi:ABC-type multidrug transport system fused ATPase/permease subunit
MAGLLFMSLGVYSLIGIAFIAISVPLQAEMLNRMNSYRLEAVVFTDKRAKLLGELLANIRLIKMFAWESYIEQSMQALRRGELHLIRKVISVDAIAITFMSATPNIAFMLTMVAYTLVEKRLDPGLAFASLALFNAFRVPLRLLPSMVRQIIGGLISIHRIRAFLLADELDWMPEVDRDAAYALEMFNGHFQWDGASDETDTADCSSTDALLIEDQETGEFLLSNIDIRIPRGQLVMIVGAVGSGKSSLLSALVGEMHRICGAAVVSGSVAYCPQSGWIQNATLRENITFGRPFDEAKYWRVVHDCALGQDLSILPSIGFLLIGVTG